MPQRLRASDVSRQLGDAGHIHSEWHPTGPVADWEPGYRSVQHGPRLVHLFHDGPGEEHHLDLYALAQRNLGYSVTHDQQPGGGRQRLHVIRP
jgi:hypothetical protein